MIEPDAVRELLQALAAGRLSPQAAFDKLQIQPDQATHYSEAYSESQGYHHSYETVGDFAKIDHQRTERTGFPEVIWGQDKTAAQIIDIMRVLEPHHPVVMATRVDALKSAEIQSVLPQVTYSEMARICAIRPAMPLPQRPGRLSILTAGTADLPVAEEAALTAELCGFRATRLWDVGVAGIHRLLSNRHVIAQSDVLIVVAGMEGALPSVVAGLADCPVIAVPTSIGYGASFNGLAPLLTMLNSCATGIGVVNIDNGFGAAILAGQILRTARRMA
ncbi:MAG: NCAIR mutase (PurE)-related protein [Phormidesmis priestleyi Ana]|uniref:NCAIR mutase (PurE)-related protein n=1 Tax=Phormidesmis priestleyi Ana TaxID=1666911 RepID=A0A0P7Z3U0_9CYAN|nr:MAG: NCAIR mutase (PurE)-related protein [Phormidesmis priestleyi Ana]